MPIQDFHTTINPRHIPLTDPNFPWVDTGITLSSGQRFTISATGQIDMYPPELENAMNPVGPDGCSNNKATLAEGGCSLLYEDTLLLPYRPGAKLLGRIGSGNAFEVGRYADLVSSAAGQLYLSINDYYYVGPNENYYQDNRGGFQVTIITDAPNPPPNEEECRNDSGTSANPIKLRDGDKQLSTIDFTVQTPAGAMTLTRFYRQSNRLDTDYQFMGLGWSHSHRFGLSFTGTAPNRLAKVLLPEGRTLQLQENGAGHFDALAGSNAMLDYAASPDEYTLTLEAKDAYIFAGSSPYLLQRRTWPTGEGWAYLYDGSNRVSTVTDGYGRELRFSYRSGHVGTETFKNGQLWRVGDQTALDLATSTPTGRYVEFDYLPESNDGTPITTPKALLGSVRDVRGEVWTYDYYGQDSGENSSSQLDLLTETRSPSVDTTGDGVLDGAIKLQRLTYDFAVDIAVNGTMEEDNYWTPIVGSVPSTNARSTLQVHGGSYSRRVVASAANQGIEGTPWQLVAGRTYTIRAWVYVMAGSNNVQMKVNSTSAFNQTSSQTGTWQELTATYTPSSTTTYNRLQFVASSGASTFYVDDVSILETSPDLSTLRQERGLVGAQPALADTLFSFKVNGDNLTTETTAGLTKRHQFANGTYLGLHDPLDHSNLQIVGDDYRPLTRVDPNGNRSKLQWSTGGKNLERVINSLGHQTTFAYHPNDTLQHGVDAEGQQTAYFYDEGLRQPTLLLVKTDAHDLAINGGMEVDSGWTSVGTPLTNERRPARVDSGIYARYVQTDAANEGIEGVAWNLTAHQTYVVRARVFVESGTVKMQVPGIAAFDRQTQQTGVWETLTASYTPIINAVSRRLQFVAQGSPATFYVDSVSIWAAGSVEINGGMEVDSGWSSVGTPTTNTRATTHVDSGTYSRHVVTDAANEGIESAAWNLVGGQTYTVQARVYVQNGTARMRLVDNSGVEIEGPAATSEGISQWETLSCVYTPSSSLNNVKVQFISPAGAADFYADTLMIEQTYEIGINGGMEVDSGWTSLGTPLTNERRPARVDSGLYARYVKTDAANEGIEGVAWNLTANQTYLIRARVFVESGKVKMQVPGIAALDAQTQQTGVWETLTASYTPTADITGKQLQFIALGNTGEFYVDSVNIRASATPMIEVELNGGMELDSGWSSVGTPTTNARVGTQVDSGDHARYVVADAASEGIESTTWDVQANQTYTLWARVFVESGTVQMQVPGIAALDVQSQQTGVWETLTVTYTPSSDAASKTLQFVAQGGAATFYVDSVSVYTTRTLDVNGGMELDSGWSSVGTPTTNVRSTTQIDSGVYSRQVVTDAANEGIESAAWNLIANQSYTIRARVYPDSGTVKLRLVDSGGAEITGTADTSKGTDAWETLSCVYTPSSSLNNVRVQFISPAGAADFYADTLTIELARELPLGGDMEVDSGWSSVGTPTTNTRSARVDTGSYFRQVVTDAANEGIQSDAQTLIVDHTYLVMARVYLMVGNAVKLQITGGSGFDALSTTTTGQWQTLRAIHQVTTPEAGSQRLQVTASQSGAHFYVDSVHLIDLGVISGDIAQQIQWQEFAYDRKGRVLSERTIQPVTATLIQETSRTYYASGVGNGLLKQLIQTDVGGMNDGSTTYTYDTAGRVIQTQQNSNFGSCELAYTVYDAAGNGVAAICNYAPGTHASPRTAQEASALYNSSNPDENHVTTYGYDPLGRRITTTMKAGSSEAQTTLTVYDGLNRVTRTVTNFVVATAPSDPFTAAHNTFTDHGTDNTQNLVTDTVYNARGLVQSQTDVLGNVTLYGYDAAGHQVKVIQNASNPSYNVTADPDLSDYTLNNAADQDIMTTFQYDANGNIIKTADALGNISLTVYDELNRVKKVVRNAHANASVDFLKYDLQYMGPHDARSETYAVSGLPDTDLITRTEYDAMGRVVRTYDELDHCTRLGYDLLGRQVYTVTNWQSGGVGYNTDPATWVWNGTQWVDNATPTPQVIPHGTNNDQNIITRTFYDRQGRVLYTQDINGSQTRLVYDGLGRQVKSIQNWVDNSVDPALWVWANNQWENGSNVAIHHGTKNDQNIITETQYDSDGRVLWTRDVLGRQQRPVYDAVGRRTRMVQNWHSGGAGYTTDPTLWAWDNGQERWEDNNGTEIPHGSNTDLNIVTETLYDDYSRVVATFDPRHNQTRFTYNLLGRRTKTVTNYVDEVYSASVPDEDLIQTVTYDLAGRVVTTTDPAGRVTRFVYDRLGRRIRTIANYVVQGSSDPATWVWDGTTDNRWEQSNGTAISHGTAFDQNLISDTLYNRAGQVVATRDARGTLTSFTYDTAGRRQVLIQASGSPVESQHYTVYDKGGRVLRSVRNWQPSGSGYTTDPAGWLWDATQLRWEDGANAVIPHGPNSDQNLVTSYTFDALGHVLSVTDPVGNLTSTIYYTDGQVKTSTDAAGYSTEHRYDALRRLTRVVQAYQSNGADPANWLWDATQWEDGSNNAINHGTRYDRNIIVDLTLDKVGRRTSLRDPRGKVTTYTYDQLNRRTGLSNPLSQSWTTAHSDLSGGRTRQLATDPLTFQIQQDFDRLGRLVQLSYLGESTPKATPDVAFTYDAAGNRTLMSESNGVSTVRNTRYTFDQARRVSAVEFDTNGDSTYDQTVSYTYDQGGLRTELRLPDNKTITYTYDVRGQLVSLTDWDSQASCYAYDQSGRLVAVERPNGMHSRYTYDTASRLRQLRHTANNKVLGHFAYEVDARGNRTQAVEMVLGTGTGTQTITSDNSLVDYYQGSWSTSGLFMQTTDPGAKLRLLFFGKQATLTLGTGADHGICDIYVNNRLWQSIDSYATSTGEDSSIVLNLASEGPHTLEVRNTADKHPSATGRKLRFKQLAVSSGPLYDLHTIQYAVDDSTPGYDALGRVVAAKYRYGGRTSGPTFREYAFSYDVAGNRTQQIETLNGTPTTTNYSYDNANRLTQVGAQAITYDAAGRLTNDGILTYAWDRASRLLSAGGSSYAYNGVGQRLTQTVGANVTQYLLDTQPGLYRVLTATTGAAVDRFVHGPTGIHAQQDSGNNWEWMLQDGLGSVRSVLDDSADVLQMSHYAPYGAAWGEQGTVQTPFGFTGEQADQNDLVHLRARYLNPSLGVFPNPDLLEGNISNPMSLNRYSYVEGHSINWTDPSGEGPNCRPTCPQGEYFQYNRSAAASHAVNFAYSVYSGGYEPLFATGHISNLAITYSGLSGAVGSTGSALFISEVFLAGGLPMTGSNPSREDFGNCSRTHGGDYAWRPCPENNYATYNWRSHPALVSYITSSLIGAKQVASLGETDLRDSVGGSYGITTGIVVNDAALYDLAASRLGSIRAGDYIFADVANTEGNDDHGYIVVGWGSALNCYDAVNQTNQGTRFNLSPSRNGNQVPYVVDFSGAETWTQTPRPRPFYCSRFNSWDYALTDRDALNLSYYAFGPHEWKFYSLPDSLIYIPCSRQYTLP